MEHTSSTNRGAYHQAYDHWPTPSRRLIPLSFGCSGRECRPTQIEIYRTVFPHLSVGAWSFISLDSQFNDTIFKCLAWSIRHFMIFQQNYFGNFTHFLTLQEYLQKRCQGQIGDPIDLKYRPGMVMTLPFGLLVRFFLTLNIV